MHSKARSKKAISFCPVFFGGWLWGKPPPCKDFDSPKTSPSWSGVQLDSSVESRLLAKTPDMWTKLVMDHPGQIIYQLRTINVMRIKRIAQTRPSWVSDPQNLWSPMNGECFKQLSLGAFCSAAIDNGNSSFCICRIQPMVGWCRGSSRVTCFGKWKVSKCDTSRRLNGTCKIEVLLSCTFTNAMRRHSWDRLLAGGRHGSRAEVLLLLSSWSSLFYTNELVQLAHGQVNEPRQDKRDHSSNLA